MLKQSPQTPCRSFRPILFLALLLMTSGVWSCSKSPAGYSRQMESIRFGDLSVESSAFIYIAEDQKLFEQNGLDVAIQPFDTGPSAIEALLKDQVDLTSTGEFAFIVRILANDDLSILTSMDKYQAFYLVGRTDLGIKTQADLAGKTIGVVKGALPEFYLGRFLDLRGISYNDVHTVNVKPAHWVDAIANGEVDAVVISNSYLQQMQARLQDRMVAWPVQSNQDAFSLVFGKTEWVNQHPEAVRRFLLALVQAQDYFIKNPAAAQAIIKKQLNLDGAFLESDWPHHQFSLSLDESLISAMEDETRWMMQNGLTTATSMPDYLEFIHEDTLKGIAPEAVNIFR